MGNLALLRYEYLAHWGAVLCYVLATVVFVHALLFDKPSRLRLAVRLTTLGLLPHAVAILLRWYVSGHGPYLNQLEAFSSSVWVALAVYLLLVTRIPRLAPIGAVVVPIGFLLMGAQLLRAPEIENLPPTFQTVWLLIHIFFNKLSLGAMLAALGCAVFYLRKEQRGEQGFFQRLPSLEELDRYAYRLCAFAFVFWSITIIAGAIWAYRSWGRYWGWDPIETWSFVTWLTFGLYMHARRFQGMRGHRAAYFLIVCFALTIVTLFVIPFITRTIHTEYLL